jgi:protein involved in polysaccharide export with SLBB domain
MILLILLILIGQDDDFMGEGIGNGAMFQFQPLLEDIDSYSYIVGPGDILWFFVQGGVPSAYSGTGTSIMRIGVTPDGYAIMPSVGVWKVSGLTLNEATAVIENGFASRYPGLRGKAGLACLRTFRLPVTGYVASPGIRGISGANRLVYLLNKAGGITSAGSWTAVQIIHSNGDTTEVNITDYIINGNMLANPYLNSGDRVHVPEAEEFVWVEGAVRLSESLSTSFEGDSEESVWNKSVRGMVEYIPGETVSCFIRRVGGTKTWAYRDSCYIRRSLPDGEEEIIRAPLDNPLIDPELLPGDIVICPGVPPTVAVTGLVYSPGLYPHTAGMDAYFYIFQAGGLNNTASESGIRIVLTGGQEKKIDEISVIPPGAAITVPRKTFVGWQDPLLIFTSLASIIIAWKSLE